MSGRELVGRDVAARLTDGSTWKTGRVVAYSDQPMYQIERDDGSRFYWVADLCAPVEASTSQLWERINNARNYVRTCEATDRAIGKTGDLDEWEALLAILSGKQVFGP